MSAQGLSSMPNILPAVPGLSTLFSFSIRVSRETQKTRRRALAPPRWKSPIAAAVLCAGGLITSLDVVVVDTPLPSIAGDLSAATFELGMDWSLIPPRHSRPATRVAWFLEGDIAKPSQRAGQSGLAACSIAGDLAHDPDSFAQPCLNTFRSDLGLVITCQLSDQTQDVGTLVRGGLLSVARQVRSSAEVSGFTK